MTKLATSRLAGSMTSLLVTKRQRVTQPVPPSWSAQGENR